MALFSMKLAPSSDITGLLKAWADGNPDALEQLTPLVYDELRRIARRYVRHRSNQTLQTTALVHEAYLRLVGAESTQQRPDTSLAYAAAPTRGVCSVGCFRCSAGLLRGPCAPSRCDRAPQGIYGGGLASDLRPRSGTSR